MISEIILSISCALVILSGPRRSDIIFFLGLALALAAQIAGIYQEGTVSLVAVFKSYFLFASVIFFISYSKRFHAKEQLGILGTVLAAFLILSSNSSLMMFCSMSLFMISSYSFSMTRERLSDTDNTTLLYSIIVLILLYKVSAQISTIFLLSIMVLLFVKTKNRDIESFIMVFVLPIILYLCLKEFNGTQSRAYSMALGATGMIFLSLSSIMIMGIKNEKIKRPCKYGLFYLGNILMLFGHGSIDTISIALMLLLLIPFIYSQQLNPVIIFNMGMLPVMPAFIAKIHFAATLTDSKSWIQLSILSISSIIFWIYASYDLVRQSPFTDQGKLKGYRYLALFYLSILAIIASAIFFNYIQDVLKISLESVLTRVI